MKRTVLFLHYILQQDQESMMFKVFLATCENPLKNDFVSRCKKYLDILNIKLSFDIISEMSKYQFKRIVKQKTAETAFQYLLSEKNKQSKIYHIITNIYRQFPHTLIFITQFITQLCFGYSQLNFQRYLLSGIRIYSRHLNQ